MEASRRGAWLELLRWHKPSGRLILLIPALWSLWLTPQAPPPAVLVGWIVLGGLAVSGAGCIANDLWDRRLDPQVERTASRPLAAGAVSVAGAVALLLLCLLLALLVVLALPDANRGLCLLLAVAALPPVLLYPSAMAYTVSKPKVHSNVAAQHSPRGQPPARVPLVAAQGISTAKPQHRASTAWG